MRVTLFARVDTARNPYILLYKAALENQGLIVDLEREFSLGWLINKGKTCDVIHLHWIEAAYKPTEQPVRPGLAGKLTNNRFFIALRAVLRVVNFSTALFWAKLQKRIIVYTVHNLNRRSSGRSFWPFIILSRIAHHVVLSLANQIHVHNHYTRNALETIYKRKSGIAVIPHGNYISCYPNQVSQQEARRQLDLPDNAFVYLFLGLLRPYKGLEDLIGAFKKLNWSSGRLLIAGQPSSTKYEAKLLTLTRRIPAIKLVLGFVPDKDIQLYINACNICVLPYKDITTSGAALLALSFGRPIIAPNKGAFPELITPKTGILYAPSQPKALALALEQAGQHVWSEAEILDYVDQFAWDKLGKQLAKLYQVNSDGKRHLDTDITQYGKPF